LQPETTKAQPTAFTSAATDIRLLRDTNRVRTADGELTRCCHEAVFMVDYGCFDVLQTDAALAGGISGLIPLAHQCARRGVFFTPHTWGNGLMIAAGNQLTCGTVGAPYIEFPYDPPNSPLEARDFLLTEPIRADAGGMINLSERPGPGVDIDEERLRATRLR
jgi:L-alanine-DL-glutamate epimerase-like enolase superfamily enzyme